MFSMMTIKNLNISPLRLKQAAIGIALAAPALALVQSELHRFNEDTSYKCRYFTPEQCKVALAEEAESKARMAAADLEKSKETKADNDSKLANFRPHGWE